MGFHTNDGTERIRIASDGVVCIGSQNKTWATAYKVFQVGAAALSGQVEGDGTTTNWTNNCYFDSGNSRWEYSGSASDQASRISMADGKVIFNTGSNQSIIVTVNAPAFNKYNFMSSIISVLLIQR